MPKLIDASNCRSVDLDRDDTLTVMVHSDCDISYHLQNGNYSILIFIDSDKDITLNEDFCLLNADVSVNYIEVNDINVLQKAQYDLSEGSNLVVNSTYIGIQKKQIDFNIIHSGPNSSSLINNNVVCLKDSSLIMNVIGHIKKGSHASSCHQKSHCLTIENPKAARVLPILQMDENDIEASHSLSSGTLDKEILFYMNSRGLSDKEALQLILMSYLLPNEEFYKPYVNGSDISAIVERKVNQVCSI